MSIRCVSGVRVRRNLGLGIYVSTQCIVPGGMGRFLPSVIVSFNKGVFTKVGRRFEGFTKRFRR